MPSILDSDEWRGYWLRAYNSHRNKARKSSTVESAIAFADAFIAELDAQILATNLLDGERQRYGYSELVAAMCADGASLSTASSAALAAASELVTKAGNFSNTPVLLAERIIVRDASQLADIDSTKEYFIDGQIDLGTQQIVVPSTGLTLRGYDPNISRLYSSEDNYTMFVSPVGGSGNLFIAGLAIQVDGANSKVYDLEANAPASPAIECNAVNYESCTSLGEVNAYRQGLEINTARFGGMPDLTLSGAWAGGFRISTSIVRGIDNAMTSALFVAGAGFTMASRFNTDVNADLGTTAPLLDFAPSNFPNSSTLQLEGAIITRGGVLNPDDATILPNVSHTDVCSSFLNCKGITNTHVGGSAEVTSEAETVIAVINDWYDMAGTFTASDLQHFDSPSSGVLRHLGQTPREYQVYSEFVIEGTASDEIGIRFVKYDASAAQDVVIRTYIRPINSLVGARDVSISTEFLSVTLDQNDTLRVQLQNRTSTDNLLAENGSFFSVFER